MGKEKTKKRYDSFRSFSFNWRNFINFFRRSSGFTLVELLTVLGIIGILLVAAILILDPVAQAQKANDVRRKSDIAQIQRALETYFNDNNKYPANSQSPLYRMVRLDGSTAEWGTQFSPYMSLLPKDPRSAWKYVYFASSNRQSYFLYASLERPNDKSLCNGGIGNPCSSLIPNGIPDNSCGGTCNFGATSPNTSP